MAQTGYTPISIYYSATAAAAPASGNLVAGELAINTADGKLFYKDSSGVVQTLATKGTGSIGGATTQVQYNLAGALAGSANMVFDGSTLTTLNSAYTGTLTGGTGIVNLGSGQFYKDASGNVCIGTTTPASGSQLTVSAPATINNTVVSGFSIELNALGTGNRNAYIDLHSDDTYTDYGLRIIKGAGANGEGTITKRGTGAFNFINEDASAMLFWTTNTERMRIDSSGNVGIGTGSPSTKLHVAGVITATQGVTGTPIFSCYPALDTTISSATQTVIANNTEEYDLGGCYNNTGSTVTLNGISVPPYSFAPNVAGYYSFNMTVNTELSVSPTRCFAIISKNGIGARVSENQTAAVGVFGGPILYYLNGTGDYVTAQIWLAATTPKYSGGFASTRFQGSLIRAA